MADREPIGGSSRPSDEMQSLRSPQATPHSGHDLELLAAAADREADSATRTAAEAQVAACAECATLATELRAVAIGLAELPRSRPVPRDMRITANQAARARRGSAWRRLLRPFGTDGLPALRPIAAALTTLGLAGILLTALPLGLGAGSAFVAGPVWDGAGNPIAAPSAGGPVPASTGAGGMDQESNGSKDYQAASPGASAAEGGGAVFGPTSTGPLASPIPPAGATDTDRLASLTLDDLARSVPELSPLAWLSVILVVAGLGLFALRFVARRIA